MKVVWLSAGVSSFIAGYLAKDVDKFIYIDIPDQHPDSIRFIKDCYLDELDPNCGRFNEVIPDCGIMCEIAYRENI